MSLLTDRIPTEHEEQRELVRWFRQTWPGVLIHAIPNGGARSKATAGRLKAEGVVSGIPDLFVPAWRLWIEMKRVKGGSLSKEQRAIIKQLESVGYWVIVGKGAEDAKRQISAFFDQVVLTRRSVYSGTHDAAQGSVITTSITGRREAAIRVDAPVGRGGLRDGDIRCQQGLDRVLAP